MWRVMGKRLEDMCPFARSPLFSGDSPIILLHTLSFPVLNPDDESLARGINSFTPA